SFHDLLAFEATCHSWRAVFSSCSCKYTLAASFPPLLLQPDLSLISTHSGPLKKFMVPTCPCHVTDIANQDTTYKYFEIPILWWSRGNNASPSPREWFGFSGASYGHLIFSSNKSCVVFDVFTRFSVSSPQLPVLESTGLIYGALTAPLSSPNSHLIIKAVSQNLFWRVGSQSWVGHSLYHGPIKQIVIFQGKVFGMDSDRRLFKVDLTPQIRIQELLVIESRMINKRHFSNAWLVACGDMLLLVGFRRIDGIIGRTFEVFRLDQSTEPALWLKMEKLENWAIFISRDQRSQALSCINPEKWGGRSNCIYCYDWKSKHWIALELGKQWRRDGSELESNVRVTMDCGTRARPMWVIPSMFSLRR
uniref:KIB1-4 beta-propeller domain-containing protein n=1 Tax=Aegilops tauschii subsp. strangulata TaxID=200361 RepID=A0A453QE40_AEGTS